MIAVIGHHPEYVQLAEEEGWTHFQIAPADWDAMSPDEQWQANRAWLDKAIADGATIRLATPPRQVRAGSWFERELRYLAAQGFRPYFDGTYWELVR